MRPARFVPPATIPENTLGGPLVSGREPSRPGRSQAWSCFSFAAIGVKSYGGEHFVAESPPGLLFHEAIDVPERARLHEEGDDEAV